MITVSSVEAQSRFGELIDCCQLEPVEVTRHGRPVAYVVSVRDMQDLAGAKQRREEAVRWYSEYRSRFVAKPEAGELTDADVARLVQALR